MKSKPQITKSKFLFLVLVLVLLLVGSFLMVRGRFPLPESQLPIPDFDLIQEFSGRYYMGDGLGLNCVFELNPDNTFKISWRTDAGGKADYEGLISVRDHLFILETSIKVETPAPCFHQTFTPVNWGERKYLLPNDNDELSEYINSVFCEKVQSKNEPRANIHGLSYLRTTDIEIQATGYPKKQDGRLQCP